MEIQYTEIKNIRLIKLIGKLDTMGVDKIETKFAGYCSGENARVLVDLSAVNFLTSIGIRLLTSNAKSLLSRNGRMVLLNPNSEVQNILDLTGIPDIIPMYEQLESAEAVLLG